MSSPTRAAGFSPRDVANEMVPQHASCYGPQVRTPHGSGMPLAVWHRPATSVTGSDHAPPAFRSRLVASLPPYSSLRLSPSVASSLRRFVAFSRPAFSLIELMIGIVILGLGLIMVATIFPVAWDRARTLSEFTTEQAVVDNAQATVQSLVHVSSPSNEPDATASDATGFLGDLLFKRVSLGTQLFVTPVAACPDFPSDDWVHALNLENVRVVNRAFVAEDLWQLQDPEHTLQNYYDEELEGPVVDHSYFKPRVRFGQRIDPPLARRKNVNADGLFTGDDTAWDSALDTHRFCWAVLHRLPDPVDPNRPGVLGTTRTFDAYYVTLRRPQPTYRYARQDPASAPNPCDLTQPPVAPAARPASEDVLLPVPWRVQVQFPATLKPRIDPANVSGIPTEIDVPPANFGAGLDARITLVEMFSPGTQFIDEINGQIYRVVKRRLAGASGDQAVLTLDREVFVEDVDLQKIVIDGVEFDDPRCETCEVDVADAPELLRTVWVFPPPVAAEGGRAGQTRQALTFAGSQPVVGIDVRTLNVAPTR